LEIERQRGEAAPRESPQERRRRETDLRSGDKTATISGGRPPTESTPPNPPTEGERRGSPGRRNESIYYPFKFNGLLTND